MRPADGEVLHFSENPAIETFTPIGEHVWAVGYDRAPDYWFPRDCPRAMAWGGPSPLLGPGVTRVHLIEYSWLARLQTVRLYAYRLPAASFHDIGHAMVSPTPVTPISVAPVGDLVALHEQANIELRLCANLWPWWHEVTNSTLTFSGIRLRNATPPPPT
jgi:hypothetical protein